MRRLHVGGYELLNGHGQAVACLERGIRQAAAVRRFLDRFRPDGWTAAAVGAGLLWAGAFPPLGMPVLGWLAPLAILLPILLAPSSRAFGLGFVAGVAHHLASLHWLLFNPFPAGAIAGWIALSLYLALYPALWSWTCRRLLLRWSPHCVNGSARAVAPFEDTPRAPSAWTVLGRLPAVRQATWTLVGAAFWVALEMVRARLFSGFPWNTLGVSQVKNVALIQLAALSGVSGVSFLMAWLSLALLTAVARLLQGAANRTGLAARRGSPFHFTPALRALLPPVIALTATLIWGARDVFRPPPAKDPLRVALVQPAIPQKLIFDPDEDQNRFERLLELSAAALRTEPDLLVWPEASLPSIEPAAQQRLLDLIADHQAWFICGADDAEPSPDASEGLDWYNAALLIDPSGRHRAAYRKQQLVIFGEYVPLERWLPWLARLTPIGGSLRSGAGPVPFELSDPAVTLSVVICFEDTFARLVRHHVTTETDFLLNLTNDAWFGRSAAHWQHLATATFRAVENRLPLVRCANNGISGWVDEWGAWHELDFGPGSTVYDAGFKVVEIPRRRFRQPTLYNRWGDWFGGLCGLVSGLALGSLARLPFRRGARPGPCASTRVSCCSL